jgi:hypothetical protein
MKTETARQLFPTFLASLECGRIGIDTNNVISPFLVYPLVRKAVPIVKPREINFDCRRKLPDHHAQNETLLRRPHF